MMKLFLNILMGLFQIFLLHEYAVVHEWFVLYDLRFLLSITNIRFSCYRTYFGPLAEQFFIRAVKKYDIHHNQT